MDAIQDARDFLKDNGQDGTLRALDTALQYKTDLHLSCELDSRIASGVVEDLSRTLNQAVKLLTTLLASAHRNERDYMPSEWHEAVDEAKEFIVMIKGNRDEPIGGVEA